MTPTILPAFCQAIKVVIADSTLAGVRLLKPLSLLRVSGPTPLTRLFNAPYAPTLTTWQRHNSLAARKRWPLPNAYNINRTTG
jgi:hypothetical protein